MKKAVMGISARNNFFICEIVLESAKFQVVVTSLQRAGSGKLEVLGKSVIAVSLVASRAGSFLAKNLRANVFGLSD